MSKLIKKYIIEKWWFPTAIFFILVMLYLMTSNIEIIPSYLFIICGIMFLSIAGTIQLFNKKWLAGILNLGLSCFTLFIMIALLLSVMTMFGPDTDTFADNLELPKNVKLNKPIDSEMGDNFKMIKPNSKTETIKDKIDFELYNSFQPGLYEYDLWIDSKESGIIFLKAYEITQEIQLSNPELQESSRVRINNTNGVVQKFSTKDDFTIYEGDWGKPYGARFEIWFKSDKSKKEIKIFEKNYIIEGWMR